LGSKERYFSKGWYEKAWKVRCGILELEP